MYISTLIDVNEGEIKSRPINKAFAFDPFCFVLEKSLVRGYIRRIWIQMA